MPINFLSMLLVLFFCFDDACAAMPVNPSYVASDGSGSSCTLESPCALSYATNNATAGDVVNIRGGTYNFAEASSRAISPSNSGSEGNLITFQAYTGETPLFVCTNRGSAANIMGIYFSGKSYIKVSGISFQDFYRWAYLHNASHHNEITGCKFFNSTTTNSVNIFVSGLVSGSDYSGHSTHNWIHDNEIYNSGSAGCAEGSDLIKIGSASTGDFDSNYNTVERNTVYHAGHTLTEDYGKYNVWRNNVFHNEGWKENVGTLSCGRHVVTISIADPAIVSKEGHGYSINNTIRFQTDGALPTGITEGASYFVMSAGYGADSFQITDNYGGTTPVATTGSQSGIHTSGCSYCYDDVGYYPGDGKYGHRCMSLTGYETGVDYRYNIVEGNRIGYASTNPNNNGSDGLTLGSPGNIVRYNKIFGSDGPGINLKRYSEATAFSGANNRIYNNTVYNNGRYTGLCTVDDFYACTVSGPPKYAIYQYGTSSIGNAIKNNILYAHPSGEYRLSGGSKSDQTWANNLCDNTDGDLGCMAGAPTFSDTTLDDYSNVHIKPNLSAASAASPQIDGGTNLTLANGAGDNNATLHVDDALYFQDGTWGSSLSNIQADWIAIGTVTNVVQISSIDYENNTITLAEAKSWADDAPIWLYKKSDGEVVLYGSAPDYGAHEYQDASPTTSTSHASGSFNLR